MCVAAFRPSAGRQPRLPPEDHPHQQRADSAGPSHQPGGRGETHSLHQHRLPLRRHHTLRRAAQVRITRMGFNACTQTLICSLFTLFHKCTQTHLFF